MRFVLLLFALSAVAGAACAGPSPVRPADPPPLLKPLFPVVIPKPTGRNGYEELVLAIDTARRSPLYRRLERGDAGTGTLSERRRLLGERPVQDAFALVRRGLGKPVASPRDTLTFSTLLPEISAFRTLARALLAQQYVQFAEGRTQDALGTARLLLRFARGVQTDTMISGLVGAAITGMTCAALGERLDQLSARDCELLFDLCREALAEGDGASRMVELERRGTLASLDSFRRMSPDGVAKELGLDADSPETRREVDRFRALIGGGADNWRRFWDQAQTELNREFDRIQAEMRKPAWERDLSEQPPASGPAGALVDLLRPSWGRVADSFSREQANLRLLAVHAAILRSRWENGRPPTTLESLGLGALAVDPFTGQPLQYEPGAYRYRLRSSGPAAPADDPQAVGGRKPVDLSP